MCHGIWTASRPVWPGQLTLTSQYHCIRGEAVETHDEQQSLLDEQHP